MDTDQEVIKQRTDVLRKLAHGEGLTLEAVEGLDDADRQLFGDLEPEQLYELIKYAASMLPPMDVTVVAFRTALGLRHPYAPMLTDRRVALLEELDVSLRTLYRHEEQGAETLARQIDLAKTINTGSPAIWQEGNYKEIKELRERVMKLEVGLIGESLASDRLAHSLSLMVALLKALRLELRPEGRNDRLTVLYDFVAHELSETVGSLRATPSYKSGHWAKEVLERLDKLSLLDSADEVADALRELRKERFPQDMLGTNHMTTVFRTDETASIVEHLPWVQKAEMVTPWMPKT